MKTTGRKGRPFGQGRNSIGGIEREGKENRGDRYGRDGRGEESEKGTLKASSESVEKDNGWEVVGKPAKAAADKWEVRVPLYYLVGKWLTFNRSHPRTKEEVSRKSREDDVIRSRPLKPLLVVATRTTGFQRQGEGERQQKEGRQISRATTQTSARQGEGACTTQEQRVQLTGCHGRRRRGQQFWWKHCPHSSLWRHHSQGQCNPFIDPCPIGITNGCIVG